MAMQTPANDPRQIAGLVPMARLLEALGFAVNERARRAPCRLHSGSNPTAFSWREDGRWHCHSCGAGGDRIALVRTTHGCSFREAVEFLAALAGVKFRPTRLSQREIAQGLRRREQTEQAAWQIADETARLRRYYTDALHRAERLQERIGNEILRSSSEATRETAWGRLARIVPAHTFYFAAWNFVWDAKPDTIVRFVLAPSAERRRFILGDVAP
jgi:CHC2 zinc finger